MAAPFTDAPPGVHLPDPPPRAGASSKPTPNGSATPAPPSGKGHSRAPSTGKAVEKAAEKAERAERAAAARAADASRAAAQEALRAENREGHVLTDTLLGELREVEMELTRIRDGVGRRGASEVEGDEFIVGLKRENADKQLEVTQLMSELKVIEAKTAAARRNKEELKQKLEHNVLSIETSNDGERAGRNGEDSLLITPTGEGAGAVQLLSVPSPTRLSGRSPGRSSRPKTPQVPQGQSDTATRRGSRLDPAGLSEAQAVTKPAEQQQPLYGEYDQKFASA